MQGFNAQLKIHIEFYNLAIHIKGSNLDSTNSWMVRCCSTYLLKKKNLSIYEPEQFKLMFFKGQLYLHKVNHIEDKFPHMNGP